jgi:hypothetical protein
MSPIIFIVEEDVSGGYTARAIDHCIFTEADTMEAIEAAIADAVECHFETAIPFIIQ